jgi:hypothetical protein
MIYDGAMMTLVHCFLPGDVPIVDAGLLELSWWNLYYRCKK